MMKVCVCVCGASGAFATQIYSLLPLFTTVTSRAPHTEPAAVGRGFIREVKGREGGWGESGVQWKVGKGGTNWGTEAEA